MPLCTRKSYWAFGVFSEQKFLTSLNPFVHFRWTSFPAKPFFFFFSQKTQKMHFCLFLSLLRTVSQIYRLSHINALCINESQEPKDQSMKFWQELLSFRWWLKNSLSVILKTFLKKKLIVGHSENIFEKKMKNFTSFP